jgi:tetratricopeptide (TPR) repeat protein
MNNVPPTAILRRRRRRRRPRPTSTNGSRSALGRRHGSRGLRSVPGLVFWGAGVLLLVGAFVAGYAGAPRAERAGAARPVPVTDPVARAEALRLCDDAVRARHEERFDEAVAAARAAREVDETLPGIDAFLAEMAFQRQDSEATAAAARAALARGESESSANLLLALDAWRTRALRGKSAAEAAEEATRLLTEGAQTRPSDESIWYFWAEMMRFIGRKDQAQRRMLWAMHRLQPWRSAAILDAKRQLATSEAASADGLPSPVVGLVGDSGWLIWLSRASVRQAAWMASDAAWPSRLPSPPKGSGMVPHGLIAPPPPPLGAASPGADF